MNAKLKAKWIKALRSGKYKQGSGMLKDSRSFCCLVVLAEIKGCVWRNGKPFVKKGEVGLYQNNSFGSIEYAGTEYLKPSFSGLSIKTQERLGALNDDGKNFEEIADVISKTIRSA